MFICARRPRGGDRGSPPASAPVAGKRVPRPVPWKSRLARKCALTTAAANAASPPKKRSESWGLSGAPTSLLPVGKRRAVVSRRPTIPSVPPGNRGESHVQLFARLTILSEAPRAPFRLVRRLPIAVFVGLLCLSTAGAGGASYAGDDGGPTRSVAREASPFRVRRTDRGPRRRRGPGGAHQDAQLRGTGFLPAPHRAGLLEAPDLAEGEPRSQAGPGRRAPRAHRGQGEDYLKKSNALETSGSGRSPGTTPGRDGPDGRESQGSDVLREIFAALDDDPYVIAEWLARQTLADRLIHNWYARDERFHGDLRRRAEAALAGVSSGLSFRVLGPNTPKPRGRGSGKAGRTRSRRARASRSGNASRVRSPWTPRLGKSSWIDSRASSDRRGKDRGRSRPGRAGV